MEKILILGAKGMLGSALAKTLEGAYAWDREDADALDFEKLKAKVINLPGAVSAIVNCVAFNDVDGAELKREAAFALNTQFPGQLAELCKQLDIPLVHFSTNYVFDGELAAYHENDAPNPLSEYGRTKFAGEQLVAQKTDKFYLVRTAVLFGPAGSSQLSKRSFVDIMLDLSKSTDTIKAVRDEVSSVTYAVHLAEAVKYLLHEKKPYGVYHITNIGQASWYELAKEMFAFLGRPVDLVPVTAADFPRKAPRPKKAVLLNTKLYALPPWQEALREYLLKEKQAGRV